MAYRTIIHRLLLNDYPNSVNLTPTMARLRNILMHGNRNGIGPANDVRRLLKLVYATPHHSYIKVFVDNDVQFDPKIKTVGGEAFDITKIYTQLLSPEGWLEEEVFSDASNLVNIEILRPIRELISVNENAVDIIALSTAIFCLNAYKVMTNDRRVGNASLPTVAIDARR